MHVIHKERNAGKTTELIALASDEGGYIVCHSHKEAHRISRVAEISGKQIPFPITYDEYLRGSFCGRNIKAFYIDNVDLLLARIAKGVPVKAISINDDCRSAGTIQLERQWVQMSDQGYDSLGENTCGGHPSKQDVDDFLAAMKEAKKRRENIVRLANIQQEQNYRDSAVFKNLLLASHHPVKATPSMRLRRAIQWLRSRIRAVYLAARYGTTESD